LFVRLMVSMSEKSPVIRRLAVAAALTAVIGAAVACGNTSATGDPKAAVKSSEGGGGGRGGRGGRRGGGGAQPVVTAKVVQRDMPVDVAAVGNVEAYTSVSVRSQVTGQLQEAFFHEGDVVKKGD